MCQKTISNIISFLKAHFGYLENSVDPDQPASENSVNQDQPASENSVDPDQSVSENNVDPDQSASLKAG